MIKIQAKYLAEIKRILFTHVPGFEVRAYGSRVNGSAEEYSDLDLAIVGDGPIDWRKIAALKNAFSETDLPFIVDVVDWHALSSGFSKIVGQEYEVIQKSDYSY